MLRSKLLLSLQAAFLSATCMPSEISIAPDARPPPPPPALPSSALPPPPPIRAATDPRRPLLPRGPQGALPVVLLPRLQLRTGAQGASVVPFCADGVSLRFSCQALIILCGCPCRAKLLRSHPFVVWESLLRLVAPAFPSPPRPAGDPQCAHHQRRQRLIPQRLEGLQRLRLVRQVSLARAGVGRSGAGRAGAWGSGG